PQFINLHYNFCCLYSLQNNKPMALAEFETCVKLGYSNYTHLFEDSDLDNIRNEERYKILAKQVRAVGDHLYILCRAEQYNTADNRPLPKFTYQAAGDPNLTALRKAFNLDSVAGTGSEVSQILNLLHWIHNLVPHNGSMENPAVKNAMSMIAVCKKEKRGLNCRGLATVLNECYLSLGIKSRFITCMPKDSLGVDNDCHVINMVYAPSLKKWLWIDPTFDAYVMNENGDLLSIEEVRERIIKNRPMILNPDANWNHQSSQTKEHYLMDYMAKNLYKLSCAVSSEYDTETNAANKTISYIDLLPLDYYMQKPDKTEHVGKTTGTTHVTYNTNNPVLFWQIPE
ncbi:MAG: transglutaminase-like domain-containing protein, partial [Bacteroidia bacterium]